MTCTILSMIKDKDTNKFVSLIFIDAILSQVRGLDKTSIVGLNLRPDYGGFVISLYEPVWYTRICFIGIPSYVPCTSEHLTLYTNFLITTYSNSVLWKEYRLAHQENKFEF